MRKTVGLTTSRDQILEYSPRTDYGLLSPVFKTARAAKNI